MVQWNTNQKERTTDTCDSDKSQKRAEQKKSDTHRVYKDPFI